MKPFFHQDTSGTVFPYTTRGVGVFSYAHLQVVEARGVFFHPNATQFLCKMHVAIDRHCSCGIGQASDERSSSQ